MIIINYETFRDATESAKYLSTRHNTPITFGRKEQEFFVEIPDEIEHLYHFSEPSFESYNPEKTSYLQDDIGHQDFLNETAEESWDYVESMSRSEEDGWFYDFTDGGWENNLIDPNS